jgi:type IV pilus assembly protein PilQ
MTTRDRLMAVKRSSRLMLATVLPLVCLLDGAASLAATSQPGTPSPATEETADGQDLLAQAAVGSGPLELKVRRLPNAVEVVIEGTGPGPQLQQFSNSAGWEGQLTLPAASGLRRGPQKLSLPEAGLQSISLEGAGNRFWIQVSSSAGGPVARPVVSADGQNLILTFSAAPQPSFQTGRLDLNTPGRVPQQRYAPPLQPRAAAPPVGDMAVGSMVLRNRSFVNVSGPPVTLTLRNAPARDALMAVAQMGGYGFVYVDGQAPGSSGAAPSRVPPVSITFRNESFSRAVNSILLAAGLQGKREGNLIVAGPNVLGTTFGSQLSKVYRLNQVSANSAADYLASLGATINKTFTTTSTSNEVASTGTPANNTASSTATTATTTQINSFGASNGPLVGLIGTTDSRLGTITLVGDSSLVAVAENYLKQLDLRQRQVALAVRILDVNLENTQDINNSFAFRWGNNFIVNDNGQLLGAFGRNLPPGAAAFNPLVNALGGIPPAENPSLQYPRDNFFDFVRAQIQSQNTKLLASPTLILQENPSLLRGAQGGGGAGASSDDQGLDAYRIDSPIGRSRANEAAVRVGTNVITNVTVTQQENGGSQCELELSTAGLILGARVEKIDDNGFVTFSLSPSVSAVTDSIPFDGGCTNRIDILSVRRLDTGAVRVRDGQTLILTGVISDFDRAEVSKWPILGDMPLVGQFFRGSSNRREKRELVIMVTPRIIEENEGGTYGYGYNPASRDARQFVSTPQ